MNLRYEASLFNFSLNVAPLIIHQNFWKLSKLFPWWNWTFWFILDCDRKILGAHYAPYCTTVFVMQHKYISPLIYPITNVINIKLQWMVQCTFHIPIQFFSLILSGCIQLISLLWFKWIVEFNLSSINGHKIHCPSWISTMHMCNCCKFLLRLAVTVFHKLHDYIAKFVIVLTRLLCLEFRYMIFLITLSNINSLTHFCPACRWPPDTGRYYSLGFLGRR